MALDTVTLDPLTKALAAGRLSDATMLYIVRAQQHFDDLKHVATTLGGVMVLAATGAYGSAADHPALPPVRELWQEASDGLYSLAPPSLALPFHAHLSESARLLNLTFRSLFTPALRSVRHAEPIMVLKSAWQQMAAASKALPGFSTVNIVDSCCSMHAKNLLNRLAVH